MDGRRRVIDFSGVAIGTLTADGEALDFAEVHFGALHGDVVVDFAGIRVATVAT